MGALRHRDPDHYGKFDHIREVRSVPQIKPPCGGCRIRAAGCHGSCEAYLAYKAELAAYRAKRDAQRAGPLEAAAVRRAAIIRAGRDAQRERKRKGG